jgi:hypothetical protein
MQSSRCWVGSIAVISPPLDEGGSITRKLRPIAGTWMRCSLSCERVKMKVIAMYAATNIALLIAHWGSICTVG